MSYARMGHDSDVYVYMSYAGYLACHGCSMEDTLGTEFQASSTAEMVEHLIRHIQCGYKVPAGTFVELMDDDEDNFSGREIDQTNWMQSFWRTPPI